MTRYKKKKNTFLDKSYVGPSVYMICIYTN